MGSFQTSNGLDTSCGYLLQELQMIWDEVGEDEFEREKALLDLEEECLEVYRRKVDRANMSRARLHQELAESEAEFTHLLLSLGEPSLPARVHDLSNSTSSSLLQPESYKLLFVQPEKTGRTLKEQLDSMSPALQEMRLRKEERVNEFRAVQGQIQKISDQMAFPQQKKKVQSQVITEQDSFSISRPTTSSRHISSRSLNGGFSNATTINRRLSLGIEKLESNGKISTTHDISFIRKGRAVQG